MELFRASLTSFTGPASLLRIAAARGDRASLQMAALLSRPGRLHKMLALALDTLEARREAALVVAWRTVRWVRGWTGFSDWAVRGWTGFSDCVVSEGLDGSFDCA